MRPAALIFDCDGTLADTMPLHWKAWRQVTQFHGIHFTEDRFYELGGVPARHILQMLAAEQGLRFDPIAIAREKEEVYILMLPEVRPVDEVVAIAQEFHLQRIPMAVASGGIRPHIERVLSHLGIREWFQAVVTSEDVVRQKPAPDIFLMAAERLGAHPHGCRAFEDTDLGIEAIRAAGMEAIDIRPLRKPPF